MVPYQRLIFLLVFVLVSCSSRKAINEPILESGVGSSLAQYRKSVLSNIRYGLEFTVPANEEESVTGRETVTFHLTSLRFMVQLDFKGESSMLRKVVVNGNPVPVLHRNEHLLLQPSLLNKGINVVEIEFEAGNAALNRNSDFLYTLFVPDRARTVFPCFDQPDLKANYSLTLHLPPQWTAISNAEIADTVTTENYTTYRFKSSDLLSTYHFAFAAGNFQKHTGLVAGMKSDFLYRENDERKIKTSLPAIFSIHSSTLKYFEKWTGIPYPFQKFGFVAIPGFQFGGMENPGAIQYKESALFLDAGATQSQLNSRNNLIAHETAHMWFGDLVTMDWFSDVWMKEVFANFMADKSAEDNGGMEVYALKFLIDHFPAAYDVDRTQGANPISQPLDNLKDAGSLYGNIIYHKAPIMMRQLENLMGKKKFQSGIREYLQKFANANASWSDLIRILDHYTTHNLEQWNRVWVNESGRPVIEYTLSFQKDKIHQLHIYQRPEFGSKRTWPQTFEISLFYPDTVKVLRLNFDKESLVVQEANGLDKPLFILFNSAGDGYAEWPVDPNLLQYLFRMEKPVQRATAYISLYEQMLNGKAIRPDQLLKLFASGLEIEKEELNIKLLSSYINVIYWQFSTPEQRKAMSVTLENQIWTALKQQNKANNKKQLFKAYEDVFLSVEAQHRLYQIWEDMNPPSGVSLSEEDYTSLAFSLSLRADADPEMLKIQYARIGNSDRKKRFAFIRPAVSSVRSERDVFFNSLQVLSNRSRESDVLAALYYLHHPLRQGSGIRYLRQSLEMLEEIQSTGDIFFPQSWLQATFGFYQSKEAADIVRDYLLKHPGFNPKLRGKILQSTDHLFRAEKLIR